MDDKKAQDSKKPFILIVDDSPKNIQVLGNVLGKAGYEISFATSGKQAFSIIDSVQPDLILLDIMMPEIDGYKVCEKLKSKSETKDIPIIFLTVKTDSEDIVKGFKSGAVDFISKPFSYVELLARVKTHIDLKLAKDLQGELIKKLEKALSEVKRLSGFLPICAKCKKIRDDKGYWNQIEEYISEHSEADFSHGICPECGDELYGDFLGSKTE